MIKSKAIPKRIYIDIDSDFECFSEDETILWYAFTTKKINKLVNQGQDLSFKKNLHDQYR